MTLTPKALREALCSAQAALKAGSAPLGTSVARHADRSLTASRALEQLIAECDRHRPVGSDGKHGHGDRCTKTCGCEGRVEMFALVVDPHE